MKQTRMLPLLLGTLLAVLSVVALSLGCSKPALTPAPVSPAPTPERMSETVMPAPTPQPTPAPTPDPNLVEIGGQIFDLRATELRLSVGSAQELADAIALFPNLERVTAEGLALTPEEILAIRTLRPALTLICDVDLFGQTVPMDAAALDLSGAPETDLAFVLSFFPALTDLTLGETAPAAVQQLKADREALHVTYRFRGQTVSEATEALDLSGTGVPDAAELNALLLTAPMLKDIVLDDPNDAEIAELAAFAPREKGVTLHCTVTLLDRTFAADAEVMDFGDDKLTDEDAAAIERVLPVMTALKEVDLYKAKLSKETMDRLFDGYPDLFFGWTFSFLNGRYTVRSDETAFAAFIGEQDHRWAMTEDDFAILRYCKGLQALDLGHCGIRNLDFLRNWPHLKILILADTPLTDIHVIAELKDLEYLELFLTTPDSYEPLTHLQNLIDLNLCHTKKEGKQYRDDEEIMMLTQIKSLERLWISKTLTAEQAQMLRDNLPGVEFDFYSTGSTQNGWRTHPRYYVMYSCFKTRQYRPFD